MPGNDSAYGCPPREAELEAAMNEYSDMVYRIALTRLKNVQDAEDAYQEAFFTFYRKNKRFSDENHKKAWLIRVTLNCCRRELAKRSRHAALPLEEADAAAEQRFDSPVLTAVMGLDEKLRTVTWLYYFEGLSAKEAARVLRISEGAVFMRLSRARAALREELDEEWI